jgi:uncharacterized protein (TIGR02246 family)
MRLIALFALVTCSTFAAAPEDAIKKVLDDQVAAWNRADIDTFMIGYDNSPDTTFVGKSVQRGWEAVRKNYHERYGNPDKMGHLDFSDIEVKMLGSDYATVLGKFHLKRTDAGGGEAGGIFTLLFHKTKNGWRIIQDHTA